MLQGGGVGMSQGAASSARCPDGGAEGSAAAGGGAEAQVLSLLALLVKKYTY